MGQGNQDIIPVPLRRMELEGMAAVVVVPPELPAQQPKAAAALAALAFFQTTNPLALVDLVLSS